MEQDHKLLLLYLALLIAGLEHKQHADVSWSGCGGCVLI
jgi:hypothetical protein